MSTPNPSEIGPGESKLFRYYGEMIPNQILIENLSTEFEAQYIVGGEVPEQGWHYFGTVAHGETASIWVNFPTTVSRFTNRSSAASIIVGGDGIFPFKPGEEV
ncbi:MAG: hypothetical protein JST22_21560 [Bacteroidetes bacterium]|nr:hypothetical protein [Bacteroidota bacterium]